MKRLLTLCLLSVTTLLVAAESTTPPEVQGRWICAQGSGTTYWDQNNAYVGGGRGSACLYVFDAKGNYSRYTVLEVRNGSLTSTARLDAKGTVSFEGDTFTLHPMSGHYHFEQGSSVKDRAMNAEDLGRQQGTYHYRTQAGADGKTHLIVPFDDGSSMDFRPSQG